MQHSETLGALATALAAAQGEIENATKNANNPHFRSQYADLAEIINTVRPVLAKHGLSVVQIPGFAEGEVTLDTMLLHSSGEWIRGTSGAPIGKADAQGVGSATTYLRRYSLAAVCGIAQEDDDGNAASQRPVNGGAITSSDCSPARASAGAPWDAPMPFGDTKDTPLGEHTVPQLRKTLEWCRGKDTKKFADLIANIEATIEHKSAA